MSGCENCVCIKREDAARMAVLENENNLLRRELIGLTSSVVRGAKKPPTYTKQGRFIVRQLTGEGRRRSHRRSRGRSHRRSRGRSHRRSRGRSHRRR